MAFDFNSLIQVGKPVPPITWLYGVGGVGKTTFTSFAPAPVYLMTENGLTSRRMQKFPFLAAPGKKLVENYNEMMFWLEKLREENHAFETVVIDSLDAFEPLVLAKVCADNGWRSIEQPGYGKGYIEADAKWLDFIRAVQRLRDEKQMMVFMIGHVKQDNISPPDTEPYSQYAPNLHKRAAALINHEVDNTLFANRPVKIIRDQGKFNQESKRAVQDEAPRLYTRQEGGWIAKNRYDMPAWMPLQWDAFAEHVPFLADQAGTTEATLTQAENAAV